MRKVAATVLAFPIAIAVLYACSSDESTGSPSTPDSGVSPSPTSTSTTSPTSTSTTQPPTDSSVPDSNQPESSGPFTPATLGSKLVLWLDADRGYSIVDGGVVWKDQSTQGNDAIQNDMPRQPQRLDGGTGDAGARGVLRFLAHEYLRVEDDTTLQWGTSDYAMFVVMRHTNDPAGSGQQNYAIVYGKWTDTSPFPGMFLWANYPNATINNGYVTRTDDTRYISSDGGLNDGKLRLVGVRKLGDKLELRVDGAKQSELLDAGGYDAAAFDGVGQPGFIGGRPALFQALVGDIAEIVAFKGTLSDLEQANVEDFLKARHGL